MLYKFTPLGYFGRVTQNSQGHWMNDQNAVDDGLEVLYSFKNDKDEVSYLLSSNMPYADRTAFANQIRAIKRSSILATGATFWFAIEFTMRNPTLRAYAPGWRLLACTGVWISAFIPVQTWLGRYQ